MPSYCEHSLPFFGDAFSVFQIFKDEPNVFFLDSSLSGPQARFSYIGFSPAAMVKGKDLAKLKRAFDKYRCPKGKLNFPAGAVGYLGYDGALCFGLYDNLLTIDHEARRLIVSSPSQGQNHTIAKMLWRKPVHKEHKPFKGKLQFKSNFTKAQFIAAVKKALAHIRNGDIYQINLSHKIEVSIPHWEDYADAGAIYGALRQCSPSDHSAYFFDGKQHILSSSPEQFIGLRGRHLHVKPMKGTRPRGKMPQEDARFKEELRTSPKEIAELLMVTDLERNDLGRVCTYGSVNVKAMRTIEEYATVFQATSTVEGRLHKNFDQFDLLKATFPSGSVTGCPKIEAMKIIKKLENGSRGAYTGALGYMSFTGDMDFNVLIRTLFLEKNKITFHVGSGIVADSDPEAEYEETWVKAQALQKALQQVLGRREE